MHQNNIFVITCFILFLQGVNVHNDDSKKNRPNNYEKHFKSDSSLRKRYFWQEHLPLDTNRGQNQFIDKNRISVVADHNTQNVAGGCSSYMDVCGDCAGVGKSRVDRCNVCEGDNRCISCDSHPGSRIDSCGNCLLPQDDSWNNCSIIVSAHPRVLDKAVGPTAPLHVQLSRPPAEPLDITCSIIQGTTNLVIENTSLDDNWLLLNVPTSQLTGECTVECSDSGGSHSWGQLNLSLVDSHSLTVSSVSPPTVTIGVPIQLQLTVHGLSTLVDLFCFSMNSKGTVEYISPTNQIAGNPMSSTVTCPPFVAQTDSTQYVGVSYSRSALSKITTNNTIKVGVQPIMLVPIKAEFSEDLQFLNVEFNQNVIGPANCSGVFRSSSLQMLGEDVKCEYKENKLLIRLGTRARIQPRNVLRFSPSTSLRQQGTSLQATAGTTMQRDSITVTNKAIALPTYRLVGFSRICGSSLQSVSVVSLSNQPLFYNWSVVVTETNAASVPSQHTQRRNLLVWLGAREILRPSRHNNMNRITINSSLLVPKINYRVEVVARNSLGVVGKPVHLDIQLSSANTSGQVDLTVLTPETVAEDVQLPLEAQISSPCGKVSLQSTQFSFRWRVLSDNNSIELESNGPKATVPVATLQATKKYIISCEVVTNTSVVTKKEEQIIVKPGVDHLTIVPADVVQGTGHPIHLDVTKSFSDTRSVQFQWTCVKAQGQVCFVSGTMSSLQSMHAELLTKPQLWLPAGTLPVGSYRFTIEAMLGDTVLMSSATVKVVAGHPPLVTVSTPSITSSLTVTVPATIQGTRSGCWLQWRSVSCPGCRVAQLTNLAGSQREINDDSLSYKLDSSLTIPAGILQQDTMYRLRLTVTCSAAESSHADITVSLPVLPKAATLQVSPLRGIALQSPFTFSTEKTAQVPSIYSFGFYSPSGSPLFFHNSAYFVTTQAVLPAFNKTGGDVRTVLRVCSPRQLCTTVDGPVVFVTAPASFTSTQISSLIQQTMTSWRVGQLREAVASTVSVLETVKATSNETTVGIISAALTTTILQAISRTSQRLDTNPLSRPGAILLLDSVSRILPLLQFNDSSLSQIIAFRDKIAKTPLNPGRPSRLLENMLPMEPRVKRQHPLPADTPPETPETVNIWLRTSESAILSFSQNKSNEEKRKLVSHLDNYIGGMCQGLVDTQPVFLGGQIVNISVQKISVSNSYKTNLNLPSCSDCSSAKLILGKAFATQYKSMDTICLSGLQFPLGVLDTVLTTLPQLIPLSSVFRLKVLVLSASDALLSSPAPTVTLMIPLIKVTVPPGHHIKCFASESGSWSSAGCKTSFPSTSSKIVCKCPAYKYYSVYAEPIPTKPHTTTTTTSTTTPPTITTTPATSATTPATSATTPATSATNPATSATTPATTAPTPTTTMITPASTTAEPTTTQVTTTKPPTTAVPPTTLSTQLPSETTSKSDQSTRKVAFRIAEDYEKVVGGNTTKFSHMIKYQVASQLKLPNATIQDINVTKAGSILVTMAMQDTQEMAVGESIDMLTEALGEGQLSLQSPDAQPLKVPKQPLMIMHTSTDDSGEMPTLFLLCATLVVFGIVLLYVGLVSMVTKRNQLNEDQRIIERKNAHSVPRYLPLPQPQTLDGSAPRNLRQTIYSGEELDSGIFGSDGGRRNVGKDAGIELKPSKQGPLLRITPSTQIIT